MKTTKGRTVCRCGQAAGPFHSNINEKQKTMKFKKLLTSALCMLATAPAFSSVSIREAGGWLESAYVTFDLTDGASTYAVYYQPASGGEYLKLDSELVRDYGSYGRADALGLAAGEYRFKVVPVNGDGTEMTGEDLRCRTGAVEHQVGLLDGGLFLMGEPITFAVN